MQATIDSHPSDSALVRYILGSNDPADLPADSWRDYVNVSYSVLDKRTGQTFVPVAPPPDAIVPDIMTGETVEIPDPTGKIADFHKIARQFLIQVGTPITGADGHASQALWDALPAGARNQITFRAVTACLRLVGLLTDNMDVVPR